MDDAKLRGMINMYAAEQRELEVIWFYNHAKKLKPNVIVEIGIKEGGNLKILSTLPPKGGLVIGIDPRKEIPWVSDSETACVVEHVCGDSHAIQTIRTVKDLLGDRLIDVLFIDGDHSYEGMLKDFYDYSPLVREGGVVAVHDIYYLEDVTRAWKDVPGNKRFESKKLQSSIGIGFIIKEQGGKSDNSCTLSRLDDGWAG